MKPSTLEFTNHQRTRRLDLRLLEQITLAALAGLPGVRAWDIAIHLVGDARMAEVNETHLGHEGPTDVITFDYSDVTSPQNQDARRQPPAPSPHLHGEILICLPVAIRQAREFRTTWQSEVVRYIVHALLHLCGYDDLQPAARREMKRHENQLVRKLARRFRFAGISK